MAQGPLPGGQGGAAWGDGQKYSSRLIYYVFVFVFCCCLLETDLKFLPTCTLPPLLGGLGPGTPRATASVCCAQEGSAPSHSAAWACPRPCPRGPSRPPSATVPSPVLGPGTRAGQPHTSHARSATRVFYPRGSCPPPPERQGLRGHTESSSVDSPPASWELRVPGLPTQPRGLPPSRGSPRFFHPGFVSSRAF